MYIIDLKVVLQTCRVSFDFQLIRENIVIVCDEAAQSLIRLTFSINNNFTAQRLFKKFIHSFSIQALADISKQRLLKINYLKRK